MTISLEEHVARAIGTQCLFMDKRHGILAARAAIAAVHEREGEEKRIPKRNYLEEDCDELDRRLAPDPAEGVREREGAQEVSMSMLLRRPTDPAVAMRAKFEATLDALRLEFPANAYERGRNAGLELASAALKGNGEG